MTPGCGLTVSMQRCKGGSGAGHVDDPCGALGCGEPSRFKRTEPKNDHMAVVVKTVLGSHFGIGEFTNHFRTYLSGDWDVHWGHGHLDFGPDGFRDWGS